MKKRKSHNPNHILLAFTAPALIFYMIFKLGPAIVGFYFGMTDWNGINQTFHFIWFDNYIEIFTSDKQFWASIIITLKFVLALVITQNVIALTLATLIESQMKTKNFFRTVFYMPNMISLIIGGYMWMFIFTKVLYYIAENSMFKFLDQSWIGNPFFSFIAIVILSTWGGAGYLMVIYIAGIQGVSATLIEAASIDGATRWQSFWNVTLPSIRHAITICVFITLSNSFQIFDAVYSLTGGGPGRATAVVAINIFNEAFKNNNRFGYASAKSMVLFAVILVITYTQLKIMRKKEGEA